MQKLKTNRAMAKRFKLTASGRLKRTRAFKNHILTKKRSKRKNKLAKAGYVDKRDMPRITRGLGLS